MAKSKQQKQSEALDRAISNLNKAQRSLEMLKSEKPKKGAPFFEMNFSAWQSHVAMEQNGIAAKERVILHLRKVCGDVSVL